MEQTIKPNDGVIPKAEKEQFLRSLYDDFSHARIDRNIGNAIVSVLAIEMLGKIKDNE